MAHCEAAPSRRPVRAPPQASKALDVVEEDGEQGARVLSGAAVGEAGGSEESDALEGLEGERGRRRRWREHRVSMQRCRWRLDAWRRALAALTVVCCVGDAAGNSVYVVGYNDYGQLGLGDYLERSTQTLMHDIPLDKTVSVAAGLYHNLVVGEEGGQRGTMYTWGRNTKGQLGHGNVESISLPKRVEWTPCMKPNSWVCSPSLCEKDVCQPHPCQFFGTKNPYYKERDMHCMKPQDVVWGDQPYPNIIEVAAGEDSSYALTEEGRIFAWGSNDWGQLGA